MSKFFPMSNLARTPSNPLYPLSIRLACERCLRVAHRLHPLTKAVLGPRQLIGMAQVAQAVEDSKTETGMTGVPHIRLTILLACSSWPHNRFLKAGPFKLLMHSLHEFAMCSVLSVVPNVRWFSMAAQCCPPWCLPSGSSG